MIIFTTPPWRTPDPITPIHDLDYTYLLKTVLTPLNECSIPLLVAVGVAFILTGMVVLRISLRKLNMDIV